MDFIYTFRQANIDRLEDAGFQTKNGQLIPATKSNAPLPKRIRRRLMALIQSVVR